MTGKPTPPDRLHWWRLTNDFPAYVCDNCGARCFGPPDEDNPDTGWYDPCPATDTDEGGEP